MKAGESLGAYVLVRELGRGGMGTVFLAEHAALGRRAAIKVLQSDLTSNPQMLTRFFNEAKASSAIKSPGIVEIYDFGRHADGSAYIVMELLEGEPLGMRLARLGKLSLGNALVIGRQIASALAPAHRAGIIHRDLKPDNVFLVPDEEVAGGERVKLLDFGIAKLLGETGPGRLTSTETVMGTPHYMSPEQCRGAGLVDARSDLYSLGCILFELISGQPPFQGEGAGDLIGAHIYLQPRKLGRLVTGLPDEVEELVQRLLAKQPLQRPQTAEEVASSLALLAAQAGTSSQPSASSSSQSKDTHGGQLAGPTRRGTPVLGTPVVDEQPTQMVRRMKEREPHSTLPAGVALSPIQSTQRTGRRNRILFGLTVLSLAIGGIYGALEARQAAESPEDSVSALASVERKRAECVRLQNEEQWSYLRDCAAELEAIEGATREDIAAAAEFTKLSHIEADAKVAFDDLMRAQEADDMRRMAVLAQTFNRSSIYATRAQQKWEAAKRVHIEVRKTQARFAAERGECKELSRLGVTVRPYDAAAANEILEMPCLSPGCDSRSLQKEAQRIYEQIQSVRISDSRTTVQLVEKALGNKCLMSPRRGILLRIGVIAACTAKDRAKVRLFFAKSNKDETLVSACPEMLKARPQ